MAQRPIRAYDDTLDRQKVPRDSYQKLKIMAAIISLIIGVPVALFVAAALGISGIAGGLVSPSVPNKPNVSRSTAPDVAVKKSQALKKDISRFKDAERARLQNLAKAQNRLNAIEASTQKVLKKESALVADRIVSSRFGANLSLAEVKSNMPERLGGNPAAVNELVKQAVGTESAKILGIADDRLAGELRIIGARAGPIISQKASQDAASLQLRLSRQIIRLAPEALQGVAKKYGIRVAERMAIKSPIVALDGPVPAADAILFLTTVADIYRQGGIARQDLTDTINDVVFRENRAVLAKKTGDTLKAINRDDL